MKAKTYAVLLIRPVDSDGTTPQPFTIHRGDSLLSIRLIPESQKSVPPTLARIHIPHDPRVGESAESEESLGEDVVRDFGR